MILFGILKKLNVTDTEKASLKETFSSKKIVLTALGLKLQSIMRTKKNWKSKC